MHLPNYNTNADVSGKATEIRAAASWDKFLLKGTVARDFRPPVFSINLTHLGPGFVS
jgi:hypothetical protein